MEKGSDVNPIKLLIWKWWRGVDQQLILAVVILLSLSLLLVTTSSASVANRIGVHENFFASRHIFYVTICLFVILFFSSFDEDSIRKYTLLFFIINLVLLALVKFIGYEVKGARRWINILGFSLQPSEFIKPFFALLVADIFARFRSRNFSFLVSLSIYILVAALLILQPDLGMLITLTGIWGVQLFIAGMPYIWIAVAGVLIFAGMVLAYNFLPHVTSRIDSFLDPTSSENYQVSQSLKAFQSGGLFGRGPGEGVVKNNIPDSHADFIFAVAGEEFGIVICIFISMVFAFVVLRGILNIAKNENEFVVIASSGIIAQFALQSIINMGVSLNMLPTKGMTLPFISYGGSSTIAVGIAIGILLALSKARVHQFNYNIKPLEH